MKIYFSSFVIVVIISSCAKEYPRSDFESSNSRMMGASPPAYVQKAWNAKYDYDEEKRLLVPKYAGSRWGSIKEYREDGRLSYQDWWVRDIKVEDLEEDPDTEVINLVNEDGIVETLEKANEVEAIESEDDEGDFTETPQEESVEEEFIPQPFLPF